MVCGLPRARARFPFICAAAGRLASRRIIWYRDCLLPAETARGLDDRDDVLVAGIFRATLQPNQSVTLVLSPNADAQLDGAAALAQSSAREGELVAQWNSTDAKTTAGAPGWIRQLVLAADQFIVNRQLPDEPDGQSIIAGYPWFADWGRDTMIALQGLTLSTGRPSIAKKILLAFAKFVDGGMLPNNFPDAGGKPEYNTVDAALWYFEAVGQYWEATQDTETLNILFPVLEQMIDAHVAGTRYQIHVDPSDGLLYAGEPGVQLTWMDAKVGDWVVYPRESASRWKSTRCGSTRWERWPAWLRK